VLGLEPGVLGRDEGRCPRGFDNASSCCRIFLAVVLVTEGLVTDRGVAFTLIGLLLSTSSLFCNRERCREQLPPNDTLLDLFNDVLLDLLGVLNTLILKLYLSFTLGLIEDHLMSPIVSSNVLRLRLSDLARVGVEGIGLCFGVESMLDLSERKGRVTLVSTLRTSFKGLSSFTSSA